MALHLLYLNIVWISVGSSGSIVGHCERSSILLQLFLRNPLIEGTYCSLNCISLRFLVSCEKCV